MQEVLVNRLGGLSLPTKSVVRLTDRPYMTLDVYRGRKTTIQPTNQSTVFQEHACAIMQDVSNGTLFTTENISASNQNQTRDC